jgi:hypothetical protein
MVSSFAFVVIKGPSLIKIISARNQDIIMVYEALIKVDIYGLGLASPDLVNKLILYYTKKGFNEFLPSSFQSVVSLLKSHINVHISCDYCLASV